MSESQFMKFRRITSKAVSSSWASKRNFSIRSSYDSSFTPSGYAPITSEGLHNLFLSKADELGLSFSINSNCDYTFPADTSVDELDQLETALRQSGDYILVYTEHPDKLNVRIFGGNNSLKLTKLRDLFRKKSGSLTSDQVDRILAILEGN